MDPVSIIGLTAAIQQILTAIYKFGHGVREAKREINLLCSELLAFRAALDHVQLNLQHDEKIQLDYVQGAQKELATSNLFIPEFHEMIQSAQALLSELFTRLEKSDRLQLMLRRLTWPLKKDDVNTFITHLERLKTFFIMATTTDNRDLCRQIYVKISSIESRLQHQEELQEEKEKDDFSRTVKQWLAPHDPTYLLERSLEAHQDGTGRWFLDGAFQKWLWDAFPPILWLRGRPGSGKSTLVSAAIKQAQMFSAKNLNVAVCYHFCSFTESLSQALPNVLGCLLAQLCDQKLSLWPAVHEKYQIVTAQSTQNPKQLDTEDLVSMIQQAATSFSKIYMFVDAPNESKESSTILQTIFEIAGKCEMLRIVVSSTEELDLQFMNLKTPLYMTVPMDQDEIAVDIQEYIEVSMLKAGRLRTLPDYLKAEIKVKLMVYANGVWVQCQLESLADKKTPRDIRNALHDVPPTLEQTYRNILARIPKADVPLAKQMLLCICFSASVLTFNQLCEAVVVEDDCANLDEGMRLLHPEDLLNMCSSLISFDITTSTVVLAHSSVWTYLTSPEIRSSDVAHFALDPAIADNIMARKCINYLSLPVFESGYCEDKSELKKRFGDWPFLRYSARYWFVHLRSALEWGQMESTTQSLLVKFFQTSQSARAGNFGAWVQAFLPNARLDIKSSTPLYYAARFGLLAIVNLILDTEGTKDLEVPCGRRGSTPLHVAAAFGRTEIVKRLLEAGADAKEINAAGETGLQWAMLYDYVDIIQLLEDAGATLEGVAPMIRIK